MQDTGTCKLEENTAPWIMDGVSRKGRELAHIHQTQKSIEKWQFLRGRGRLVDKSIPVEVFPEGCNRPWPQGFAAWDLNASKA